MDNNPLTGLINFPSIHNTYIQESLRKLNNINNQDKNKF